MPDVTVRPLDSLADFHRCVQIAREVWGDCELDIEPYLTFVVALHTGGQVLGAFDGNILVGFTKAFVGLHNQTPYLHSHMTAVLPSHRDRGIGRQLKLFQREDALRRGIRLIEWTFDPLETKNAYFNINRLGGITRRYISNFYGITSSPLHRGLPTDRLLVEWHLDSRRVVAAVNDLSPETRDSPAHVHLPAPARAGQCGRAGKGAQPEGGETAAAPAEATCSSQLIEIQSRLRSELTTWFSKGYAVNGVRSALSGIDYCLAPYSDF
jgi:predicted GNAT superfamily acetyltransferase